MSYENWKDKIDTFEVMDVRGKKMDFFPALKEKAAALKNGEGLHIIQTFEPVPLYPVLALMGFEHHTEKTGGSECHVWFYRVRKGEYLHELRKLEGQGAGVSDHGCAPYTGQLF